MMPSVSRERLEALFRSARMRRVLVIGDAMLDVYLSGDVERISPEAPVPVVRVRERRHALGGAANVAQNVVAIGARCDLLAVVGADQAGDTLRRKLGTLGIDDALVAIDRCTTVKTRIVARSQQLVRVDEEEDADLSEEDASRFLARVREKMVDADAVILEDYNKGVLLPSVIREVMVSAAKRGIPIVVDPKYRNFFEYRGASIFKPNRRELEAALGAAVDLEHPEALPASLHRLGVEHLLLTLGDRGMMLVSSDGSVLNVPTTAREVYDVVGAGDTVSAYLAALLAAGAAASESAIIANLAAGIEVGKLGAATVSPEEVLSHAADWGIWD